MPDYQNNTNNQLFHYALSQLKLRFPVAEIHRATGFGKGNISNYIKNKVSVSDNFLESFSNSYNIDIEKLQKDFQDNHIQNITPKNGLTFTELGNGQYTVNVPLIPFEAHAQYISEGDNPSVLESFEHVTFLVDQVGLGHYKAFKIKGDSMNSGKILDTQDGALVLARELQKHHWTDGFRPTDYGWIIITQYNILFKDILDFDHNTGEILCHSRNPSPEYSDFYLSLNEVFQIFKVIKRMF